jgi:uncharacterized protein involved in response to NO
MPEYPMSENNAPPLELPHQRITELKRRADAGPVFLRNSFRPFFLFAGLWAAMAVPLWLAVRGGLVVIPAATDPLLWHQHEMLFGFAAAAATGFILTAIPNWTGRLPVSGWRLGILAVLWLLGRAAMMSSTLIGTMVGPIAGPIVTAVIDLSFLTLMAFTIGRELIGGGNWRNLPVLALFVLFATGNWLFHLQQIGLAETADMGIRLAIFVLTVLITLIGGRIIPSFTRNWLKKKGAVALPAVLDGLDKSALAAGALVLVVQVLVPHAVVTAYITLIAALLHGLRLARWKGLSVLAEPLLWVMHLGYGWVVVGLFLLGLAGITDAVPESAALHALTVGGFSTMILAVMTRASLGHSGRGLTAGAGTTAVFILITLAAAARVAAPFMENAEVTGILISGALWTAAFGLFSVLYWPVFTRAPLMS